MSGRTCEYCLESFFGKPDMDSDDCLVCRAWEDEEVEELPIVVSDLEDSESE